MNRTTRRVARTPRRCDMCPPPYGPINPGDVYLEFVASPNDGDLGNVGWVRLAECAECATAYGRGHLLEPAADELAEVSG